MKKIRLVLAAVLIGLFALSGARQVSAAPAKHPLGNFTINQYSALTVQGNGVAIRYVLDMAEIPTFQELGDIRSDHSTQLTQEQHDTYLKSKTADLISNLQLLVNGQPVTLQQQSAQLSFPAGAGGLSTMRIDMILFGAVKGPANGNIAYSDTNFPERIGWKEIIANAGDGGTLSSSDVATKDRSDALVNYPSDMINSPPQIRQANLAFSINGVAPANANSYQTAAKTSDWVTDQLNALSDIMKQRDLPLNALLVALGIAFVLGGAHALSPGHGKTVAAAYLVGTRGTPIHALLLGLSVTVTHTIGVIVLGLITKFAAQYILPEQLFPYISFFSGMLLVVMGIGLFTSKLQTLRARGLPILPPLPFLARLHLQPALATAPATASVNSQAGAHVHDDGTVHSHDHSAAEGMHRDYPWGKEHSHVPGQAHSHDHNQAGDGEELHKHMPWGKAHSHAASVHEENAGIGRLIAVGASGGLLPCPSALILMLAAVGANRIDLGLILVLAFSGGLAAVLSGVGLLFLYARKLMEKRNINSTLMLRLPMASALFVAFAGILIAIEAIGSAGLFR